MRGDACAYSLQTRTPPLDEIGMSETAIAMPPFKVAAAALRQTTERLAGELARPTDSPPVWSELDWAVARAAAAMQGTSVLLANHLRWSGPPLWQSFLAEQQEQSLLRHSHIGTLLQRIDDAIRDAQIGAVALKGAALRELDLYGPGARPMGDIDLLVRPDDLASIEIALRRLDYVPAYTSPRHAVLEPRIKSAPRALGEHIENPIKIEVHTNVAEQLPVREVNISDCLYSRRNQPGINPYPGPGELMLHLLLHAAGNMRAHALRQIQLHDVVLLGGRLSVADWCGLLEPPNGGERRWWLFPVLAMAERYYPGSIPQDALSKTRSMCPFSLRIATHRQALTDVSWSNLRIHALPGIAWSRTPLEALRFIRSRALPSRAALAELQQGREHNPQLYGVPWYGISHGKRILRWLFARPPRVQTMLSLRAALGYEHSGI